MRPLTSLSSTEARALQGLLFDLDDTVLDHGSLAERTYQSLFRLRESGLLLYALTGRPAAWAEVIARTWPLHGAIGENGALAYFAEGQRLRSFDPLGSAERAERRAQLEQTVLLIRQQVPQLPPADDARLRISDFTWDIGEYHTAAEADVEQASRIARERGARVTRSSIHLHVSYDRTDKAQGALTFLRAQGHNPTRALRQFAFIGDSENDAPCFAAFRTTIGVRNLGGHFSLLPRYQTRAERGAGFVECAELLCQLRA